jgi:tRNA modification GTPase
MLPIVRISALIGTGMEDLVAAIVQFADSFRADENGEAIAINARHADALERAGACLRSGLENLTKSGPVELLASDLRGTLGAFGEILGRVDNERMLDHLFSTFCIGK